MVEPVKLVVMTNQTTLFGDLLDLLQQLWDKVSRVGYSNDLCR